MFTKKIWVEKEFQSSINIGYDLYNQNKVKSFIPTMSSIDVIEDIMLSTTIPEKGRARILIGAYGRGKSHLVLVLMALLFQKEKRIFKPLLSKIKQNNLELHDYILNYINSDKKLLPIIVNGSSTSITQSFLSALQTSLKTEDLSDLMPNTNFTAATNTINSWREKYPATYENFKNQISVPVESFMISLNEYDIGAYDLFTNIYPTLTSGSEFNPFTGINVIELYENVVDKLKGKGYSGVYIVYDEFSKYLETSIANSTISDTKLLQDFAEKCDRSGNNQMHLMLISHKDISNYIDDKLPKEKLDGWRGVSGRFKHMPLQNNFSQMNEIISAVIKKSPSFWDDFSLKHKDIFNHMVEQFQASGIIDKDPTLAETTIYGCYPLHPVSTFILPRLSEKVAQNERTLFTFLSSTNKSTLTDFLDNADSDFPLLTPDYIYDYFEQLIRKEPYTSNIYKMHKITARVLQKLKQDSLQSKIVKMISLIYIIEQFEKIPPTKDIIISTFVSAGYTVNDINTALNELMEKECIIYLKRSNGYLKIKESSGVDVNQEIRNVVETTKSSLDIKDILNQSSFDNYIYPTAYNDQMQITRYFDFTFISSDEFLVTSDWDIRAKNLTSSGVLYVIIPNSESEIKKIKALLEKGVSANKRILFSIQKNFEDIKKIVIEYNAVQLLKGQVADDELLLDEYDIYIEDLEEVVARYVTSFTRPEIGMTNYYWNNSQQLFKRKSQISALLSDICYEMYPNTPVINNESINKDILPTTAINSRNKVVSALLENEIAPNLGLSGSGQEISIMRSTLIMTGILENINGITQLNLNPKDVNLQALLQEIQSFFNTCLNGEGTNFNTLYERLTLPEYGFGIKRGVIPIYVAAVLNKFKNNIFIKNNNDEMKISTDVLNSINENPEHFTVHMEHWDDDKRAYIKKLEDLFSMYIVEKEKSLGSFAFLSNAMLRWYMSLPKFARELKEIYKGQGEKADKLSPSNTRFINVTKLADKNPREYLFDKIHTVYGYPEFSLNVLDNIKATKSTYDCSKKGLIKHLIKDVKNIFTNDIIAGATLSSIIKDFTDSLKPKTFDYLFPDGAHKTLALMSTIGNDESLFIERLGKSVTTLRIDDWSSETINSFIRDLKVIKSSILLFDLSVLEQNSVEVTGKQNEKQYTIAFVNGSGSEITRSFEKIEFGPHGKLLLNAIMTDLEEMGQSITEQEKRQVLMEIIEKMC